MFSPARKKAGRGRPTIRKFSKGNIYCLPCWLKGFGVIMFLLFCFAVRYCRSTGGVPANAVLRGIRGTEIHDISVYGYRGCADPGDCLSSNNIWGVSITKPLSFATKTSVLPAWVP